MKKFLLLLVLLCACESPHESVRRFQYGKDERTGLCFAMANMGTQSASFSYVPCTPEVEKQIAIDNQR